jgi:hypothetical protein
LTGRSKEGNYPKTDPTTRAGRVVGAGVADGDGNGRGVGSGLGDGVSKDVGNGDGRGVGSRLNDGYKINIGSFLQKLLYECFTHFLKKVSKHVCFFKSVL